MKRFMILFLAAAMVVAFGGTVLADNTANLTDGTATLRVSTGPVIINDTAGTGTTLYVATGYPQYEFAAALTNNGVSLYAVDASRTTTTGTLQFRELTSAMRAYLSGATLIGAPVVTTDWAAKSGSAATGNSVFFLAAAGQINKVGKFSGTAGGASDPNTGLTLYALNGQTGAINWQRGIPVYGMPVSAAADGGTSIFASSPITIDTESVSGSGATIYGAVAPSLTAVIAGGNGATVYAIDADDGSISGATQFPGSTNSLTGGVSGFFAAPLISGNSVYYIGWNGTLAGATIYALDKKNFNSGVSRYGMIMPNAVNWSSAQMPTPAVSGSSIYVVATGLGGWAGVTVYDTTNLTVQYTVRYGPVATSGVSASPVTDGEYIVLSTHSAVSCYALTSINGLSANTAKWTIDLAKAPYTDGAYQIHGTPAISNGYVYIPVIDTTALVNKGFVLKATLNSTSGSAVKLGSITTGVKGDPIVSGGEVWAVTYNPAAYQITTDTGARGYSDWAQFKFGADKAGANTRPHDAAAVVADDDDSGCFISTLTK